MDSLSQLALGAAVSVAAMGRHTTVARAALWGAIAGTLPDLDVFINHGNPIHNMVLHRSNSHSLLWLTLLSLPLAAIVSKVYGETKHWHRWWLALWLALITHPLLDLMTVYGTQLALPFSNFPFAVGSVFIVDPLYTVPLLIGIGWALRKKGIQADGALPKPFWKNGNTIGLVVSTSYLVWGVAVQQHVNNLVTEALVAKGVSANQLLVTPTPLNSILWRVVVVDGDNYHEGYYSLLDESRSIHFASYPRNLLLASELQGNDGINRISAFSHGFYALHEAGERIIIKDLRMGQEPNYTFSFAVAERKSPLQALDLPEKIKFKPDISCGSGWLWQRIQGQALPTAAEFCKR